MGLLDVLNSEQGRLGLGLLAAAGGRSDGAGFGQRMAEGIGSVDKWNQQKQATALQKLQMDNYKSEIDARKTTSDAALKKLQMIEEIFGKQMSPGAFTPSIDGRGPTMLPEMQGKSGIANMSIDQIAQLKALGGPDLMDAFKWANDPLKLDQGATYKDRITGKQTYMPKVGDGVAPDANGFYNPLPGYSEAQAGIEGAKARAVETAKAGLDLVSVPNSDGTSRMVPRAQAVQMLSGSPSAIPSTGNKQPTPEQMRIIQADIQRTGNPSPSINFNKKADPVVFGTTQSPGDQATQAATKKQLEAQATDIAEQRKGIMNAGFGAGTNIAKYQQLGKLLQDVDGGTLTGTGTQIASMMNSIGFKIDKNLPNKEAAAALGNEMALQLRNPANGAGMPGAMSDADRNFLISLIPNASQSAQGRKQLIDAAVSVERRKQQVAQFARNYEKKNGKLDNDFFDQMQAWSNENPLFGSK